MVDKLELKKIDDLFEAILNDEVDKESWLAFYEDVLGIAVDADDENGNESCGPFYEALCEYFSELFDCNQLLPEKYISELRNPTKGLWFNKEGWCKEANNEEQAREISTYIQLINQLINNQKTYGDFAETLICHCPQRETYDEEDEDFDREELNLEW